jgi:hypothetical protein
VLYEADTERAGLNVTGMTSDVDALRFDHNMQ